MNVGETLFAQIDGARAMEDIWPHHRTTQKLRRSAPLGCVSSCESPSFDAKRFARNFEAALWGMWQVRTQTGLNKPPVLGFY